jgi:hypothetical protein
MSRPGRRAAARQGHGQGARARATGQGQGQGPAFCLLLLLPADVATATAWCLMSVRCSLVVVVVIRGPCPWSWIAFLLPVLHRLELEPPLGTCSPRPLFPQSGPSPRLLCPCALRPCSRLAYSHRLLYYGSSPSSGDRSVVIQHPLSSSVFGGLAAAANGEAEQNTDPPPPNWVRSTPYVPWCTASSKAYRQPICTNHEGAGFGGGGSSSSYAHLILQSQLDVGLYMHLQHKLSFLVRSVGAIAACELVLDACTRSRCSCVCRNRRYESEAQDTTENNSRNSNGDR